MNHHQEQTIIFGSDARFTIMADNLIRMEYAPGGTFLNAPTLAVAQRITKDTLFTVTEQGNQLVIQTAELTLTYTDTGDGFSASNLKIDYSSGGMNGTWAISDVDSQQLPGTLRTLDHMDGEVLITDNGKSFPPWERDELTLTRSKPPFIPGYISRGGYTFFEDSKTTPLTDQGVNGTPWVAPLRQGKVFDGYFAVYGRDLYRGLRTVAQFFGKQPIPPRFAFGLWFSRYWEFTDEDLESIVEAHDDFNIPLDVLVIDMDWHKLGWTGYSWDPTFFPDPEDTLAYLRERGVKITMNLHPADGVAPHEDQYDAMCAEMGIDPASQETVPFDCTNPRFMDAYFRLLHHPFEDQGVRFWWMDWQQGQKTALEGLDPLPWLNELHWRDLANRFPRRRPMIFSRFGGPGAGRYPIGFSGDTHITWQSLAFQPFFTATAANVGFGYWSHDIGGHFFSDDTDAELYTRWVQFGAFSPVLRLHETKSVEDHRFLWNYERPYQDALIAAARNRYRMLPYITSELNHCWAQDTSLCMPMYYEYPDTEDAYQATQQYFFGRQMFIAPVTQAADKTSELASMKIWIPEGEWIDFANGRSYVGPRWIEAGYTLDQVPRFVKPGAIWVEQAATRRAGTDSYENLEIIVAGGTDSCAQWTEDDGDSLGYQEGNVATFTITQSVQDGTRRISIQPTGNGSYEGFKARRKLSLRLPFTPVPENVHHNGISLAFIKRGGQPSWRYQGNRMELIIELGETDLTQSHVVEFSISPRNLAVGTDPFVYRQKRLLHAWRFAQAGAIPHNLTPFQRSLPWLAQAGRRLTHRPDLFVETVEDFATKWLTLAAEHEQFTQQLEVYQKKVTPQVIKNQQALAVIRSIL